MLEFIATLSDRFVRDLFQGNCVKSYPKMMAQASAGYTHGAGKRNFKVWQENDCIKKIEGFKYLESDMQNEYFDYKSNTNR